MIKTWSTSVVKENTVHIPCNICGGSNFIPSLKCEGFFYVKCKNCGLVQINPQPKEDEIKKRYNSSQGNDYLSYEIANEDSFLNLQLLALKDAGFHSIEDNLLSINGRALDIGSATGALLSWLKNRNWECTGIEISQNQAEYARKRNLDIKSKILEENNFPPNSFSLLHASHLIEHLNNPASLVREAYRILVPGGRLFITTPNISGFQSRLFGSSWRSAIFDHLYLFSKKTLSLLLKDSGFTIEKISTWGGLAAGTAPLPIKRIFDKAAKACGFGDVMIIRAVKT